jgi:hypothetical protein
MAASPKNSKAPDAGEIDRTWIEEFEAAARRPLETASATLLSTPISRSSMRPATALLIRWKNTGDGVNRIFPVGLAMAAFDGIPRILASTKANG